MKFELKTKNNSCGSFHELGGRKPIEWLCLKVVYLCNNGCMYFQGIKGLVLKLESNKTTGLAERIYRAGRPVIWQREGSSRGDPL